MKEKLKEIAKYLNENYSQDSVNYTKITSHSRKVLRYDEETAISLWACGAIVCIGKLIYFINEDDGNWWVDEDQKGIYGYLTCFGVGWSMDFIKAMSDLVRYLEKYGEPVYYTESKVVFYYKLTKDNSKKDPRKIK